MALHGTAALLILLILPSHALSVNRKKHDFTYVDRPNMLPVSFFEVSPELQIVGIFYYLLFANVYEQGRNYTVLDIGMNTGYFSLLAASSGARVFAYEPQPLCVRLLRASLLAENAHLRENLCVTNVAVGRSGVLKVPDSTCLGGFRGVSSEESVEDSQNVLKVPLQALIPTRVHFRLVKIDTEGAETGILSSLFALIRHDLVDNIVVEVVPMWWDSRGDSREEGLDTLMKLQKLSVRTVLLDDRTAFDFEKTAHLLPAGIKGPAYTNFSMEALVANRNSTKSGCNLWFQFHV